MPLGFPAGERAVLGEEILACGLSVTQHSAPNLTGSQRLSVALAVTLILCLSPVFHPGNPGVILDYYLSARLPPVPVSLSKRDSVFCPFQFSALRAWISSRDFRFLSPYSNLFFKICQIFLIRSLIFLLVYKYCWTFLCTIYSMQDAAEKSASLSVSFEKLKVF